MDLKSAGRRVNIRAATVRWGALLALIALSSCSVIETVSTLAGGVIQAGQPVQNQTTVGETTVEIWISQALYERGTDPVTIRLTVKNDGDRFEVLTRTDGPLATIKFWPSGYSALLLEASSEDSEGLNRIELPPGGLYEMEWTLGPMDQPGLYNVYAYVWFEGVGEVQIGESFQVH
jgi:hypothetical protein